MRVDIKPLSVNKCWQGRRFKTVEYKNYEKEMLLVMPKHKVSKTALLSLNIVFGYSNKANDIDNSLKPFIDLLQKKYDFNDKNIYQLKVKKVIIKKGDEFIEYEINEIKE